MGRRLPALVAATVLTIAACDGGSGGDRTGPPRTGGTATTGAGPAATTGPPPPSTTAAPAPLGSVRVRLTQVATLSQPLALAVRPGDPALYVAEKGGRVRAVRDGTVDPTTVLDLTSQVSGGAEQGLLGLVFSPDGSRLYVNYTDRAGDTRIIEYAVVAGRADPATARQLLFVDQPFANHNGGNLVFGPDGKLWIGLGDGGGRGDPRDNAQSLATLLGKLLRIDPQPSPGLPYTIPPDNPFARTPGARGEIWALGLRNPWRYSFDRATGDLWIGDVGQNAREEVDFAPAGSRGGENYGWARLEGTRTFSGSPPPGAVAPILDYELSGGNCSVTAGYVYRGSRVPGLAGAFLYGDFCAGEVLALRQAGGRVTERRSLGLEVASLSSFGQDSAGELYALSLAGALFRFDPA